jgi:hypothetical protein
MRHSSTTLGTQTHLGQLSGRRCNDLATVLRDDQGIRNEQSILLCLALDAFLLKIFQSETQAEDHARMEGMLVLFVKNKSLLSNLVSNAPAQLLVQMLDEIGLSLLEQHGDGFVDLVEAHAGLDDVLLTALIWSKSFDEMHD